MSWILLVVLLLPKQQIEVQRVAVGGGLTVRSRAYGYPIVTLREIKVLSQNVLFAKLTDVEERVETDGKPYTVGTLLVTNVMRSQDGKWQPGENIAFPYLRRDAIGKSFMLCDVNGSPEWFSPELMDNAAWKYLKGIPTDRRKLPSWFLKHVDFADSTIATDAFVELSRLPFTDYEAAQPPIDQHADRLLNLVMSLFPKSSDIQSEGFNKRVEQRLPLLARVLGIAMAGNEQAESKLKEWLFSATQSPLSYRDDYPVGWLESGTAAYLIASGDRGLKEIEEYLLRIDNRSDEEIEDAPSLYPILEWDHVYAAIELLADREESNVSAAAVRSLVLRQSEAGGYAFSALVAWKQWDVIPHLLKLFQRDEMKHLRRDIVWFIVECVNAQKDASPEQRATAELALAKLKKQTPDLCADVIKQRADLAKQNEQLRKQMYGDGSRLPTLKGEDAAGQSYASLLPERVTNEDIKAVAGLNALTQLALRGQFNGISFSPLQKLPYLESLALKGDSEQSSGFGIDFVSLSAKQAEEISELKHLTQLDVVRCGLTDSVLKKIKSLKQLKRLVLADNPITGRGLSVIGDDSRLEYMSLQSCAITDDGLRHMPVMDSLNRLVLSNNPISDSALTHLAATCSKRLNQLELDRTGVTDAAMIMFEPFKELESVTFAQTQVTGKDLLHLAACPKLRFVNLSRCPVTDETISGIGRLETINAINIDGTAITDRSLPVLTAMKHLTYLSVAATNLTDEGIRALKGALPECNVVVVEEGHEREKWFQYRMYIP